LDSGVDTGFPLATKREAFALEIMLKQEDGADDDTKKMHPALAVTPR
jgi:hypothetical protein